MSIPYMVRPTKISKTAKETVSMDNGNLEFGTSCYEAGMIEVLTSIAVQEMDHLPYTESSKRVKKLNKEAVEAFQALQNTLIEKEFKLLKEMDEAYNQVAAAEAEDHFIRGFISGYRYLKHVLEFHTYQDEE